MLRSLLALALAGATFCVAAQLAPGNPDWKEIDAPPPPPLRTSGLIPLEVDGGASTLRFGVDPASVTLNADGVVRYVVVATSSTGTVNAMYEGIRCGTGEVKVYARHNPASGWVPSAGSDWRDLRQMPNLRHSLAVARQGACMGHSANGSARQIVMDLRAPLERRYQRGGANQ